MKLSPKRPERSHDAHEYRSGPLPDVSLALAAGAAGDAAGVAAEMTGADWWQQYEQELQQQWEAEQAKQKGQPSPVDDGIYEETKHGIYCN